MKRLYKLIVSLVLVFVMIFSCITNVFALRLPVYADVDGEHWAYDAIKYVTKFRYFSGYQDGSFRPSERITRAEVAKVVVSILCRDKLFGWTSFSDVDSTEWYAPYIEAGKDLFLIPEGERCFRPNDFATREDAIYALVNAFKLTFNVEFVDVYALEKCTDYDKIQPQAAPYLATALQLFIVSGYSDGTIRADAPLTRAEFATLIYRAEQFKNKKN